MSFGAATFDIDTFQHAILYQNEGPSYPLSSDMVILCVR